MKKKQITALICAMALGICLAGCGAAGSESTSYEAAAAEEAWDSGYVTSEEMPVGYAASEEAADGGYDYANPEFNTEEYNYIKENSFLTVAVSPLSTFAADVDTGSYTNFRRMLNDNYTLEDIPQGAIRTEEMINYFDYDIAVTDDDKRFSVDYEIGTCPWNEDNKLLMMSVKAKDVEADTNANNFVFLIDSSGSMDSQDKGPMAIKSFKMLAKTLTKEDRVSIVTYSGSSEVILDSCRGNKYKKICSALDSIEFGGGTNGSGGITAAYDLAEENFIEGGNNRVIIASDGDMNLGITSNAGLVDLITEKKEGGVFLTVLGYGSGNYSDANMESIADAGNGNYYYIDCLNEADRVLVDKLKQTTLTVAKDVKLQVEFNPLEVSEYRLIGYENRTMAAEDFEDDTKDGGETGAGQTVTVMYELVCNNGDTDGSNLKYQTDRELTETALNGEILTLSVRYKEPDGDESVEENFVVKNSEDDEELSADFYFTAGVAELAMILNDSDYMGEATLDTAYELVMQGSNDDSYREELGEMIEELSY